MKLTPEELEEKVQVCIDRCAGGGTPPEGFFLREICGLTEEELDEVRAYARAEGRLSQREKARRARMLAAVRRLDEFRTAFWVKRGLDEPRLASFAAFNLRQPRNGGYSDRAAAPGGVEIVVRTEGVGKEAFH